MARGLRNRQELLELSRAAWACTVTSSVGKLAVEILTSRHAKEVAMAQSTAPAPRHQFVSVRDRLARGEGPHK